MRIGDQYLDRNYNFYSIYDEKTITPFKTKIFFSFIGFMFLISIISFYKIYYYKRIDNIFLFATCIIGFIFGLLFLMIFCLGEKCVMCEIYDKRIAYILSTIMKCIMFILSIVFITILIFI
jgi:hypothetical protein